MGKGKKAATRARKRKSPTLAYTGDHGPGTSAALTGTVLEPLLHEGRPDPNRRARRRRIEVIDELQFLSLRQYQAAREIRDAYCATQKLSSGSPAKERVDTSTRPDAFAAVHCDVTSRLNRAMYAVPRHFRFVVEEICWNNTPIRKLKRGHDIVKSELQGAMTCVADHLGY